jgi:hypothetical protein
LPRLIVLTCLCPLGLLFGVTYLAENPTQASTAEGRAVEGEVSHMVATRQRLTNSVQNSAREIAYGLEHAKDSVGSLIP